MKKSFIISFEIIAILGLVVWLGSGLLNKPTASTNAAASANVSTENSKQIIEINAKGGYTPKLTSAKANMPTILRIKTSGTFDCSSSLRIPSLNYFKNLPPTGTTDIELSSQQASGTLNGLCSMGMYSFSIEFKG